jgi:hypothetical protein
MNGRKFPDGKTNYGWNGWLVILWRHSQNRTLNISSESPLGKLEK